MAKLNTTIQKGMTSTTINDARNITNEQLTKQIKQMLKPLVKDEMLLGLLAQEQNQQKIRTRFEHKITIRGKGNERLITANLMNATPREAVQKIKANIQEGEDITTTEWVRKLTAIGMTAITTSNQEGLSGKVQILTIFRKTQ